MTITAADMESKLLTVDQWVEIVTPTENLENVTVPLDGTGGLTVFSLPSGWNIGLKEKDDTDLTDALMRVGDDEYKMTKTAILSVATAVGIPASYVYKTPGPMIQSHLNYWATHSTDVTMKFLAKPTTAGKEMLAVTKEGITPFSNLDLLDRTLGVVRERYGVENHDLRVDYKSHHDLSITSLRLIVPEAFRTIETQRSEGERWSAGVQVRNSLTGKKPLSANGYLFAWACTNGMITQHAAGKYNRKIMGQNVTDVLNWTSEAVDAVIQSMEHEFDAIEALREESVEDSVAKVLADIFKTYKVPLRVRNRVMDALLESEDFTYFGIVNAITQAANDADLPEHFVTAIMEVGGDVAHSVAARCNSCKRVMV
jgi:hypothetical protein